MRFQNTSCSQCGEDFGPGDSGFSHCSDHTPFELFKRAHPELNWAEAEEISDEDLAAAAEFFDQLLTSVKKGIGDEDSRGSTQSNSI